MNNLKCSENAATPREPCRPCDSSEDLLLTAAFPYSLTVGSPASSHPLHPPSIDSTLVYPIFCKLSATSAERNPPPQYKIILLEVSGTFISMSLSIRPRLICTAPGRCPLAHSWSSLTSTSRNFSPLSIRLFTSATLVSLIRGFTSLTSFKNCGECFIAQLPIHF